MSILAEESLDRPVMNKYETLFHRHPSNPILTGKDWPYSMNSVFNAGATLLPDGSTLLLCRVEDRRGLSHLCVADRKSTRLNSSHGYISYAVFCLKKKNNHTCKQHEELDHCNI